MKVKKIEIKGRLYKVTCVNKVIKNFERESGTTIGKFFDSFSGSNYSLTELSEFALQSLLCAKMFTDCNDDIDDMDDIDKIFDLEDILRIVAAAFETMDLSNGTQVGKHKTTKKTNK